MSTNHSDDWIKEGTPREDWDQDTDYGVEVDPAEWDDYSEEQAVPVHTPAAAREYVAPEEREPADDVPEEPEATPAEAGPEPVAEADEAPADPFTADLADAPADPEPTTVRPRPTMPAGYEPSGPTVAARAEEPTQQPAAAEEPTQVEEPPVAERAADEPVVDDPEPVGDDATPTEPADERPVRDVSAEPGIVPPAEQSPFVTPTVPAAADRKPEDPVTEQTEEEPVTERVEPQPAEPQPVEPEPVEQREPVAEDPLPATDPEATAHHDPFAKPDPVEEPTEAQETVADADTRDHGTAAGTAAAAGAGTAGFASLYRSDEAPADRVEDDEVTRAIEPEQPVAREDTQVLSDARLAAEEAEERERQARLQEQRDARDARLGVIAADESDGTRVVTKPVKRQADKFFGAFAMFVLRVVVAGIMGVLAYQVLQDVDRAEEFLSQTVLPEPRLVAWILGFGLASIAALLVLGLGARFVAFLLMLVAGASLAIIRWGRFSIFQPGYEGFLGDRTLLTLAASLVIVAFGAGRFSIDGAIYAARHRSEYDED